MAGPAAGGFLGAEVLNEGLERRIWIAEGNGDGVPIGRSSVSRDLEKKTHTAYPSTVGSASRGERYPKSRSRQSGRWGGLPPVRPIPPLSLS